MFEPAWTAVHIVRAVVMALSGNAPKSGNFRVVSRDAFYLVGKHHTVSSSTNESFQ
jgi:hypothetical protein